MKKVLWFFPLLALLILSSPSLSQPQQKPLKLEIKLSKVVYEKGEPINVTITLTNISNKSLRIGEPAIPPKKNYLRFVHFEIRKHVQPGEKSKDYFFPPSPPRGFWYKFTKPIQDYEGIVLSPGETITIKYQLNYSFPPSLYTAIASYYTNHWAYTRTEAFPFLFPKLWHGAISSNLFSFVVVSNLSSPEAVFWENY
ncbi:MAG: hypothetical protein GXO71_06130, partial [Caldiserica bacterium]|nr:hypothetical protein [Caldisericota bacterium]